MGGFTLRDGRSPMSFQVDVPDGETVTLSDGVSRVSRLTVDLIAIGGSVSVHQVHAITDRGSSVGVWLPYGELSRGLRRYVTELDRVMRSVPFGTD